MHAADAVACFRSERRRLRTPPERSRLDGGDTHRVRRNAVGRLPDARAWPRAQTTRAAPVRPICPAGTRRLDRTRWLTRRSTRAQSRLQGDWATRGAGVRET